MKTNFFQKIIKRPRLIVQLLFLAVTNGYLYGFATGRIYTGPTKTLCVPGLNCYSCPGALGSCPIGSLQAVLASRNYRFSFYVVGFLMLFGSVFGRFICGWLCPFGLVQDLLYRIPIPAPFKKLDFQTKESSRSSDTGLGEIPDPRRLCGHSSAHCRGYHRSRFPVVLQIYLSKRNTRRRNPAFIRPNEPLRQAAGFLFQWKFAILVFLLILSVLIYRPFCKYICPLGAVYSLFNPIALYRYQVRKDSCIKCGKCQKACGMDIRVWETPNNPECIRCGNCVKACPTGALQRNCLRSVNHRKC